ncbi:hypothetical protein GH714_025467 [Hevea brasiliensis]|uniref:Uncharacterized protein n=1 Tax=Hevea brasiliensis TaxID=3981 RepID=A0A6A6KM09_HEVBR|nr:hypothetical protein GH714_025467 [Hevea brasiliensis]
MEGQSREGTIFTLDQLQELQQQPFLDHRFLNDQRFDISSPSLQSCLEEIAKLGEILSKEIHQEVAQSKKNKQDSFPSTSLKLLRICGEGLKLSSERAINPTNTPSTKVASQGLSTEEIVRIAGKSYFKFFTQGIDATSILNTSVDASLSGLSNEDSKSVELAELIIASADKVSNHQYDCPSILLDQCDSLSSATGNAVQRLVYYFSKALRERIDRETGRITFQDLEKLRSFNINEKIMASTPTILACHQQVPFSQVAHFAGIQAILEQVSETKKIHVIDLGIRIGVQWTVLMQALASQSKFHTELFKITAVGTTKKKLMEDTVGTTKKKLMEDTAKRLRSFAQTINFPFSFKTVIVSDMLEFEEDLFELDADETVVFYCDCLLTSLIPLPDRLASLMKVIRNLNPCIMVVNADSIAR